MVVKCGYEGSSRRVNFPSASTCRLDSVRLRVSHTGFLEVHTDQVTGRGMFPPLRSVVYTGLYR